MSSVDMGILREGRLEFGRRDLLRFAGVMHPSYKWNWHHRTIADTLNRFFSGELKRVMVFVPPQHAKSELTSRLFPAWALGKNPDLKIVLASYSASLAESMNRDVQKFIDSEEYGEMFPDTRLQSSGVGGKYIRNAERFDIVDRAGYLKTVGVGGSLTGTPADIAIIDDPHKDREEAKSALISQKVWDWYTDVLKTRLHNDSGVLLIQTRWDDMDLAGRLLKQMHEAMSRGDDNIEYWTVICFPAIKENDSNPDDPRKVGEALWPEKHSLKRLLEIKATSLRTFQSLYQQNPQPVQAGGECYKMFDVNNNTGEFKYDPEIPLHFSFDFNVNPYMSCGVFQIYSEMIGERKYFKVFMIEEVCLRSPNNTTKAVCRHLRNKYNNHQSTCYIYGDPNGMREDTRSEQGFNDYVIIREELANFRPILRIYKKAPSVAKRIDFMNAIFADAIDRLEMKIDKRCTNTINDFLYIKEESDGTKQKLKAIDPITGINSEKYGHCFAGYTQIMTDEGNKNIYRIKAGDRVLTRYGYKKVLKVHDNGYRPVKKYRIGNKQITCTPNHKFWTKKYGFYPIGHLINRNTFCIFDENTKKICKKKLSITEGLHLQDTPRQLKGLIGFITRVGLGLMGNSKKKDTIDTNGFVKLGKSLPNIIFIMLMTILLITIYPIYVALMGVSILVSIMIKCLMSKRNIRLLSLSLRRKKRLRNGINQMKGKTGTKNIIENYLILLLELTNVLNVVRNTKGNNYLWGKNIAASDAKTMQLQEKEGKIKRILRNGVVLCAEISLKLIDIAKRRIVKRNVGRNYERVYDITVEDNHEYFANGILVHNCSDLCDYFTVGAFPDMYGLFLNGGKSSIPTVGIRKTHNGYN
jgi:hypothetical protein